MIFRMKLVAEYLQHVRQFETIAACEENPRLKIALERQAVMYGRRAEVRAGQLGKAASSKFSSTWTMIEPPEGEHTNGDRMRGGRF
jgi:hypothetical protein